MKGLKALLFVPVMVLSGASVALAASEGGYDWANFGYRVLNFIIFAAIIYYAAGKKVIAFFTQRRQGIAQELDDLAARKAQAQSKLDDVVQRIADLENERKAILAEYEAQGEALKEAILAKAQRTADQMVEQAQKTTENEVAYAKDAIRAELAELIADATERLLRERLDDAGQEKLIDKYLTKVVLN